MEIDQLEVGSGKYLHSLAVLPISFLSEQCDRLAGLCEQTGIDDHYRNLFASSVWVYPMHAYVALVHDRLGAPVAQAVWSYQRNMLDEADAGAGVSMESAFMLIDKALKLDDLRMDGPDADRYELPEARVALALLQGLPESPHYSSHNDALHGKFRKIHMQAEECLAHCLSRARAELLAACGELFTSNQVRH